MVQLVANSAGVRCPCAEWGRFVLWSMRWSSMRTCASRSESNCHRLSSSSRNRPLNNSIRGEVAPVWWSGECAGPVPHDWGEEGHATMTKRRRHTPDQIIRKLAEGNKLVAVGTGLDEVCRHLRITESSWHRWVARYGGIKTNDAKRLKELEAESARLKYLVANQALDIDVLREVANGRS